MQSPMSNEAYMHMFTIKSMMTNELIECNDINAIVIAAFGAMD